MAYLRYDPFELHYVGGYLLIITLALTVFCSVFFYRKKESNSISIEKKVQVGLGAYLVSIILSTVYQILKGQFHLKNNLEENFLLVLIHLGFGIILSSLFSIFLKGNVSPKNNKS